METIERILGHEIPILPEPFLPESELRPLTEADYKRLFEEFCAAPISTLPPDHHRPTRQGDNRLCKWLNNRPSKTTKGLRMTPQAFYVID